MQFATCFANRDSRKSPSVTSLAFDIAKREPGTVSAADRVPELACVIHCTNVQFSSNTCARDFPNCPAISGLSFDVAE